MADKTKNKGKKSPVVLKALELSDQEQAEVKGGGVIINDRSVPGPLSTKASPGALNYLPQGNK